MTPAVQEFSPLISKMEKRLSSVSKFLSYHGRLTLVNSVFSALPTYYMCSIIIPPAVIQQIDRFRKHCLWSKGDIHRRGTCLAAWEPMCRKKEEGGLGIINIYNQNVAFLMKFLDKFYNHANIPWVNLTWNKLYHSSNIPPMQKTPLAPFGGRTLLNFSANPESSPSVTPTLAAQCWQHSVPLE